MPRGSDGRAPTNIKRPSFVSTSLMGIWMTTMRVERTAAEPEFQAGWPRPRGPTKADIEILYLRRVSVRKLVPLPGHQRLRERLPHSYGRRAAAAPARRARGLVQGRARHDAGSRRHAHVRHGRRARGGLRRVAFGWRHALHERGPGRGRPVQGHWHRGLPVRLRPHRRRVVDARDLLQATFLLLPYPLIDTYPHLSGP